MDEVLKIENLKTYFFTDEGVARAVDGVSVSVKKGETPGARGRIGVREIVTALSILRLVPSPPGRIVGGKITLAGRDILSLSGSGNARYSGQTRIDDIPGAHDEPEPGLHHRQTDHGGSADTH